MIFSTPFSAVSPHLRMHVLETDLKGHLKYYMTENFICCFSMMPQLSKSRNTNSLSDKMATAGAPSMFIASQCPLTCFFDQVAEQHNSKVGHLRARFYFVIE